MRKLLNVKKSDAVLVFSHSTENKGNTHLVLCYSPNSGQKLERLSLRTQGERRTPLWC